MINIYIVIPALGGGGSERVIVTLIKYLDRNKFNITLVLGSKTGKYVNEIPKDINIIDLKKNRVRSAILSIIKVIKKDKPDIVISTLGHLNLLIALFRWFLPKKTKFIARESNTVSVRNKDESYPWLFDFLFKTVYKNFDLVICQAESMKNDLLNNYKYPSEKMVVINNPIDFERVSKFIDISNKGYLRVNKTNLLVVGRLTTQKRVNHAIEAMQYLSNEYHLTIVGEGELELELRQLIERLKLKDKVSLEGFIDNPYSLYKEADFLLSTSKYEGFPNVVIEANACGLPVIAYNYLGGISEIIIEGKNGSLVNNGNIKEFSNVIESSSKNNDYDKNHIAKMTKEKYDAVKIIKKYEIEFLKIL